MCWKRIRDQLNNNPAALLARSPAKKYCLVKKEEKVFQSPIDFPTRFINSMS